MRSYVSTFEDKINSLLDMGLSKRKVAKELGIPRSTVSDYLRSKEQPVVRDIVEGDDVYPDKMKILVVDIETAPLVSDLWSVWQQGVGLNQVQKDWHMLSFAAKWLGEDEVFYYDQSGEEDIEDDFFLCTALHELLNQSNATLTQNGRKFDLKKINARFIINGLLPAKPSRVIDTLEIAKREFGFTSNKLEYMTDKLCKKYKKLTHKKFPGHELWKEVMKGNPEAWAEMKEYNIHDVLALEELYGILRPYSTKHPNIALTQETNTPACRICGSTELEQDGHWHTSLSKYELFRCNTCGAYSRGRKTDTTKQQRNNVTMTPI